MPLTTDQDLLRQRVGEVLHYLWDPIGVAGEPAAREEYDRYVLPILGLLLRGAEEEAIAEHLDGIERDAMGAVSSRPATRDSAKVLVGWRRCVMEGTASGSSTP